jgi:hypothetical protein
MDLAQEAVLARLEGRNVKKAVSEYNTREYTWHTLLTVLLMIWIQMTSLCPKIGHSKDICIKPREHKGRHDFGRNSKENK